jgi:hypothetical protein
MTPAILKIKIWLLACFSIFLPIKPLIITVGFLCISDMVVGIWKALKKKEPISSKRMSDTITKLMLYQLAIVSGFLIEKYVIEELVPITKTIGTVISIIEFKSIIESIEAVTGTSLWDKIRVIVGRKSEDVMDAMADKTKPAAPEQPAADEPKDI